MGTIATLRGRSDGSKTGVLGGGAAAPSNVGYMTVPREWILLTYKLTPDPSSRARVAVWREVRRSGALHLQQSVVAFPDVEAFRPALERFRTLVGELGGESLAVRGGPVEGGDGDRLVASWNAARDGEFAELVAECGKFLSEIDHEFEIEKFTSAELEEEEAELDKLERWHERIRARDVCGCPGAAEADAALGRAREALERYSQAVFDRTVP